MKQFSKMKSGWLNVKTLGLSLMTAGMVAIAGMFMAADNAHATAISSNNAGALIIRIAPNVDRGVEISTGDVNMDLGTVDLGASLDLLRLSKPRPFTEVSGAVELGLTYHFQEL